MKEQMWMKEALALAEQGRLLAPPNPWVGCVIVKNNLIVGRGHTQSPGNSHAEIMALTEAGVQSEGADMYVTLEPCCHWGRTPPCVEKIIRAGIKRVFTSLSDPDSHVQGKGIAILEQAGVEVHVGLSAEKVEKQLKSYLHHRRTGLPYTIIKSAASIDGRVAAKDQSSQWITDASAREDVHLLRAHCQAIMVGAGTARIDKPQLTVRSASLKIEKQPLRVVCDAWGKLAPEGPLFDVTAAPTVIFTTTECPQEVQKAWLDHGVEVVVGELRNNGVELNAVLKNLGSRGILQLLVEGGAALQSTFIQEGVFQELIVYHGNCLLGNEGLPMFSSLPVDNIQNAIRLKLIESQNLGVVVKSTYLPL
ncbi:MAG: bifunctional diaminohydroxyphosphoribosylaminopyrimidine deaminase/5-amino-6-(5-phosphoribosylamino)uracil reductase RibD [Parachlamydiales bacterium]|jgi:diaminohydroxyphosphoribosylaminopyrimidine deaminase/5-amino-6-(5-phosphoribosylamino)uracil reductase